MNHLPTNDVANRELSIEELETVAGGSLWGWVKHEATAVEHFIENPTTLKVVSVVAAIGGTIFSGWANQKLN